MSQDVHMATMKLFLFINSEEGLGYINYCHPSHVLELITHQRGRCHFFLSIIYVFLHQDLKTFSEQFLEKKKGGGVWGCQCKSEKHKLLNYKIQLCILGLTSIGSQAMDKGQNFSQS